MATTSHYDMETPLQIKWESLEKGSEASSGEEFTADEIKKEKVFK